MPKSMKLRGQCPECVVREKDYSERRLYRCKHCGRRFCHRHLKPRLVEIPTLKYASKDVEWQRLIEMAKRRKSHPDFQFTRQKINELITTEEERREAIIGLLEGSPSIFKEMDTLQSDKSHRYCLKCGSDRIEPSEEALYFVCLDCGNRWKLGETYRKLPQESIQEKVGTEEPKVSKPKKPIKPILAILLIVIILGVFLWNAPSIISFFSSITGFQSSTSQPPQSTTYNHEELVNYALSLINKDRIEHGRLNVSLSEVDSGQMHADSMLTYDFFSHWDTNGYKPYMRYTLAGGKGSVAENIAWQYSTGHFDANEALKSLEWEMMYNDADWDWGHRDNILNPFHNKVSVGIAYDNTNLYFVQDFENDYIAWSTLSVSQNGECLMSGSFLDTLSVESVNIYYDLIPSKLTSNQLKKAPYNGAYDAGTFVGMALPSGWESVEGITITAQTWVQTSTAFQIRFNLSPTFIAHGKGVYTLYLQPDTTEDSLTTYSFWYEG